LLKRALLLLALAAPPVLADDLPDLGEVSRQYFSDQEERAIGRAIMRDVAGDPRLLDDAVILEYLNQLGFRLASVSTRNDNAFNFFVVLEPTVNAFALPGGHIGVHTGLLLAAQGESELAGVLAHEIAHVTQDHIARQVAAQSQSTWPTLAALALALLAARGDSNVASAAIASTQAFAIQNQLNFTREFEREADRIGYDILERAGFDPRGMAGFFGKLQRAGRFADSSAPAYLRTHPLTSERIADMGARSDATPYKQIQDSLDFQLVRARLRAMDGTATDAVTRARAALKERRYADALAARYETVVALLRARRFDDAEADVQKMLGAAANSPMIAALAGEVALAAGKTERAVARYRGGFDTYPGYRPLLLGYAESLIAARRPQQALDLIESRLALRPDDARLWRLAARSHAQLGQKLQTHRAEAEAFAALGNLTAAINQIELGLKASDGNFRDASVAESRRREWQEIDRALRKK
jgi:predicted Zn-dependent protease